MKRIREEFNVCERSWDRIAASVGKSSPVRRRQADADLDADADEEALQLLDNIYAQLEMMPEGLESAVLTRLVDDLTLQPAYRIVTARRRGAVVPPDFAAWWDDLFSYAFSTLSDAIREVEQKYAGEESAGGEPGWAAEQTASEEEHLARYLESMGHFGRYLHSELISAGRWFGQEG